MSTSPLFPAGEQPEVPDPSGLPNTDTAGKILGGIAKWVDYKLKHRPCDWCVLAIHQGLMKSHPHPARRVRVGPNDTRATAPALCVQHAARQEARDRMAERDAADAKAHADIQARTGRRR
ncbi:MAG: hypothetical protein ABW067_06605 [Rhizobacter sp.]